MRRLVRREGAHEHMHLAVRVTLQKTVQGEVCTANSHDAREPEVIRGLAHAALHLLPDRRVGTKRRLKLLPGGESLRYPALGEARRIEAELLVALADERIEQHAARTAGIDLRIARQRGNEGGDAQVAVAPEAGQGEELGGASDERIRRAV